MTRRSMVGMGAAVAAALVIAMIPVAAHPGHDHKVLGTVVTVAADRLVVKDREGKDITITLNAATKVIKDKKPVRLDEVKPGVRVVVTAATNEQKVTIGKLIDLGTVRPTK
jgi:uncharacterized lipoprotein NlpE involved in copper resistance